VKDVAVPSMIVNVHAHIVVKLVAAIVAWVSIKQLADNPERNSIYCFVEVNLDG
jgi:hypothetical protein